MKDKHYEPCEHYDPKTGYSKPGAPCEDGPACDWCIDEVSDNDDWWEPCRRRYLVDDKLTVDMFKEI